MDNTEESSRASLLEGRSQTPGSKSRMPAATFPVRTLECLEPENPAWDRLVMQCREWHPFYLSGCIKAGAAFHKGEGKLLVFRNEEGIALYPVIAFPLENGGKRTYDLCGQPYAGPISNAADPSRHAGLLVGLRNAIQEMAPAYGWVTDFCRLNPFVATPFPKEAANQVANQVYVDLTRGYDRICKEYSGATRKNVKRANSAIQELRPLASEAECLSLADLYQMRMKEFKASLRYHYDNTYFKALYRDLRAHSLFLGAFVDGRLVGGSLGMRGNGYIFSYLIGADPSFQNYRLNNGLTDLAIRFGIQHGDRTLVLGGGVCGEDSVYAHKKSVSSETFNQVCLNLVLDWKRYHELCAQCPPEVRKTTFFPPYRQQINNAWQPKE